MGGSKVLRAALLLCAIVAGSAFAQSSQDETTYYGPRLVEEKVRINAREGYTIAATILRPEGAGPYGAVILNHGVAGSRRERARESSDLLIDAAKVFARRGYVVVMPLRRGFGATGGEMAEDPGSCSNPDYYRGEYAASQDVMAAYDYARALPYVDGNRMMLAGQSAGGMVALFAAGTRQPQGLVAVLSFAAGRGGDPDINPGVPCAVEPIAKLMDSVGRNVKVPVLMQWAENDLFFSPKISRGWFERFAHGASSAEYVLQPAFGRDGHYLFGSTLGVRYWLPTLESFLAKHHIQFQRLDAADPERQPLLALERLPNIKSEACKGLYRAFLEAPGPRAYAVSPDGRCGFAGGVRDAREVAVQQCGTLSKSACSLYAVDESVIWKETVAGQGSSK
ncbi:MAG: alpha/beta hydrolase family protein [Betaproteobacteria bacterium]